MINQTCNKIIQLTQNVRFVLVVCVILFCTFVMHAGIAHAATLTLSGTLYSDAGTTPITALVPLKIAIGTSTLSVSATTSLATGEWNIIIPDGHTISTSTPILIWTDATTSIRAALFTKASSSVNDIPNLSLYQNRVILSHEGANGTSTTLTDLSFYDSDDDGDIQYNATTTGVGLSVYTGNELYIKTGKTFAPGGPVTVHGNASASTTDGSLRLTANSTYVVGGLTTLGGNFTASSSATLTATNTPTFLFTATTTGKSIAASLPNLGALAFNGVGGGWTIATTSTTTAVTVTNGTLIAPGSTLALNSFSNTGTFTHNSGTLFFNGSTTRFIGGDAVNSSWAITTNELVWTVTSHNGKLYAGIGSTAGDAEVWEYNGSTWTIMGGDAVNSSWAVSTYESVYTFTSHN